MTDIQKLNQLLFSYENGLLMSISKNLMYDPTNPICLHNATMIIDYFKMNGKLEELFLWAFKQQYHSYTIDIKHKKYESELNNYFSTLLHSYSLNYSNEMKLFLVELLKELIECKELFEGINTNYAAGIVNGIVSKQIAEEVNDSVERTSKIVLIIFKLLKNNFGKLPIELQTILKRIIEKECPNDVIDVEEDEEIVFCEKKINENVNENESKIENSEENKEINQSMESSEHHENNQSEQSEDSQNHQEQQQIEIKQTKEIEKIKIEIKEEIKEQNKNHSKTHNQNEQNKLEEERETIEAKQYEGYSGIYNYLFLLIIDQCIVPFLTNKTLLQEHYNTEIIKNYLDTIVFIGQTLHQMYENKQQKYIIELNQQRMTLNLKSSFAKLNVSNENNESDETKTEINKNEIVEKFTYILFSSLLPIKRNLPIEISIQLSELIDYPQCFYEDFTIYNNFMQHLASFTSNYMLRLKESIKLHQQKAEELEKLQEELALKKKEFHRKKVRNYDLQSKIDMIKKERETVEDDEDEDGMDLLSFLREMAKQQQQQQSAPSPTQNENRKSASIQIGNAFKKSKKDEKKMKKEQEKQQKEQEKHQKEQEKEQRKLSKSGSKGSKGSMFSSPTILSPQPSQSPVQNESLESDKKANKRKSANPSYNIPKLSPGSIQLNEGPSSDRDGHSKKKRRFSASLISLGNSKRKGDGNSEGTSPRVKGEDSNQHSLGLPSIPVKTLE